VTFFLLLAWIAFDAYQQGGTAAAIGTTLFIVSFFVCILLHEFGHILMGRRFGVRTPDVILLPIGGVARLERIPEEPKQELLIALAGPAVTLAIILLLLVGTLLAGRPLAFGDPFSTHASFTVGLLELNAGVLVFNLIPAFPLDGGRVLRAVLAMRLGLARATRIAGTIGQLFAVGLGIWGVTQQAPLIMLVAFFIFLGAGSEATAVATRLAGRGLQVSQMMVTDFRTIPVHATLSQAADLLLAGEQREFPVVDNLGRTEGILTRDNLIRGLSRNGPNATVAQAMTPSAPTVPPTLGFQEALDRLRASGLPALPVVDEKGLLVGLLTMDNITDLLLVRRARG
jgi:Zn-dependent protease